MGAAAAAILSVAPAASGDSPPPLSGDWWVTEDTQIENTTIQVDGSLIVTNLSVLTLRNVDLLFVTAVGFTPLLNISAGARAVVEQSHVGAAASAGFLNGWVAGRLDATGSSFVNLMGPLPGGVYGLSVDAGAVRLDACAFPASAAAARFAVGNGGTLEIANSTLAGPRFIALLQGTPAQEPATFWIHDMSFAGAGGGVTVDAVSAASRPHEARLEYLTQVGASPIGFIGIGAHAPLDLTLAYVDAVGSGSGTGLVLDIQARLNATISSSRLTGFAQAMRVNRPLTSTTVGSLRIDGVDLNGTDYGLRIEGNTTADIAFPANISYSHIASDNYALAIYRWAVNVDNSTLVVRTSFLALYVIESVVIMHQVDHNTSAVLHDARSYALERVDAFWQAPTEIVWKESGLPAAGWNASLVLRVGGVYLNGVVGADGRIAGAPAVLLMYHFELYAVDDRDARILTGNLSRAGRADQAFSQVISGNLSAYRIEVHDGVGPHIDLTSPPPPYALNTTQVSLTFLFSDPETGMVEGNITFGTSAPIRFATAATPFWEVVANLSVVGDGKYYVEVRARDLAGNLAQEVFTVTIDRKPPVLGSSDPPNGAFLNRLSFNLTLTIVDDIAWLTVDGTPASLVGAAMWPGGDPASVWRIVANATEGLHTFTVRAADRAGNVAEFLLTLILDVTPPTGTVAGIEDGRAYNTRQRILHITKDPADTVVTDGAALLVDATNATVAIDLPTGESTHTVSIVDRAGNALTRTYHVTLDQEPPLLEFVGGSRPSEIYLRSPNVTLHLQTSPDAVDVTDGTSHWTIDLDARATAELFLDEGVTAVHLMAADAAGNQRAYELRIVVDLTAPAVLHVSPADGSSWRIASVEFALTLNEAGEAEFNHVRYVPSEGVIRFTTTVGIGLNLYDLVLNDTAGNTARVTLQLSGDTLPPILRLDSPANHSFRAQGPITVSGQTEPGTSLQIDGRRIDIAPDGTFSVTLDLPADQRTLSITATDPAGNVELQRLELDGAAPLGILPLVGMLGAGVGLVAGAFWIRGRRRAEAGHETDRGGPPGK